MFYIDNVFCDILHFVSHDLLEDHGFNEYVDLTILFSIKLEIINYHRTTIKLKNKILHR